MDVMWAPWRMDYILGPKPDACVFCLPESEAEDEERLVMHRGKHAFVVMNKFPYNNGHLLVAPYRHTCDYLSLSPEECGECMALTQAAVKALGRFASPEGFNMGMNIGRAAGAGVDTHLHWHIIPRWSGDASFIAVTSETRVIPQHLTETYKALKPLFQAA